MLACYINRFAGESGSLLTSATVTATYEVGLEADTISRTAFITGICGHD